MRDIQCLPRHITHWIVVETFSNILKWFGPMAPHPRFPHVNSTLPERIVLLMSQPWFFGPIGSHQAAVYLKSHVDQPGTFLVRLNPGGNEAIESAPLTISRMNDDRTITHIRIRPYRTEGYRLRYEGRRREPVKLKRKVHFLLPSWTSSF